MFGCQPRRKVTAPCLADHTEREPCARISSITEMLWVGPLWIPTWRKRPRILDIRWSRNQGARCKTIDMTQKGEQSLPGVSDLVCSLVVELAGYGKETAS